MVETKPTLAGFYLGGTLVVDGLTYFIPLVFFYTIHRKRRVAQKRSRGLHNIFEIPQKNLDSGFPIYMSISYELGVERENLIFVQNDCFLKPNWFSRRNKQWDQQAVISFKSFCKSIKWNCEFTKFTSLLCYKLFLSDSAMQKEGIYIFQMRLLQRKFFLCICNFNFELNKNFQNCLMVRICLQQTLTDACIPSLHTYLFMYWNTLILQAVGSNAGLNFFP